MKWFLIFTCLCFIATSSSYSADIIGDNSRVVVTMKISDGIKYSKFEYCRTDKLLNQNFCKSLGHKDYYSHAELNSQQTQEMLEFVGTVAFDAGLLIMATGLTTYGFLATGVGALLEAVGITAIGGAELSAAFGGIAIIAGSSYLMNHLRFMKPITQFRDQKSLGNKIINDIDNSKLLSDKRIEALAESIDIVLNKI